MPNRYEIRQCDVCGREVRGGAFWSHRRACFPREEQIARFWDAAIPEPMSGCLLWLGPMSQGYGSIRWEGARERTHRVAYSISCGPVPPGLFVCHRCDVKICINPSHLFLGTSDDNIADMISKRRHAFGERAASARLTWESVATIRQLYADTDISQNVLALKFGVSPSHISGILAGKFWRELPADMLRTMQEIDK